MPREPQEDPPDTCPVCLEHFGDARSRCVTRCGHTICNECITRLATPHCPLCRAPMWGGKPEEGAEDRDTLSRQIAEDERIARELSRQERGEAAPPLAADPDPPSVVPLPFHFSTQRAMTYANFD